MKLLSIISTLFAATTAVAPTAWAADPTCAQGYVDCVNGVVRGTLTLCQQACGGKCCDGYLSCSKFTGQVCQDGNSCMGAYACRNAKIPFVVNSCKGKSACDAVASFDGAAGHFVDSCNGLEACEHAGSGGVRAGVKNIYKSCDADYACSELGSPAALTVDINDCCHGPNECRGARQSTLPSTCYDNDSDASCPQGFIDCVDGFVRGSPGTICQEACGDGDKCCAGNLACLLFTGKVCKDGNSCMGKYACRSAKIPAVVNSCIGVESCELVGADGGKASNFTNSCAGAQSCKEAGRGSGGAVAEINSSCNGNSTCHLLGATFEGAPGSGPVTSDLFGCCNGAGVCRRDREATLPTTCRPPTCTQGYVDCVNGFVRSTNITCAAECGGNCCVGSGACEFFTGKVCKDGSCNGLEACRSAQIPAVVSSCQLDQACASVAAKGGRAGNFVDSCKGGTRSCAELGFGKGGAVQEIDGSCKATSACQGVGATESSYAWKVTGPVHSDMIGCCNSASACSLRNETTLPTTCKPECPGGYVDCINGKVSGTSTSCFDGCGGKCCVGTDACSSFTGKVCKDNTSCFGDSACSSAKISSVVGSCAGNKACSEVAGQGGTAGSFFNACRGDSACLQAGNGGSVKEIFNSCLADNACLKLGYAGTGATANNGPVTSDLNGCCNIQDQCKGKKESSLPYSCKPQLPSASPSISFEPTVSYEPTTNTQYPTISRAPIPAPTGSPAPSTESTVYATALYPTLTPTVDPTDSPTARRTAPKAGKNKKKNKSSAKPIATAKPTMAKTVKNNIFN